MRRGLVLIALLACACAHTHNVQQSQNKQGETPAAEQKEPTTPGQPLLSASPKGILEPGAVKEIQRALRKKGYEVPVNGVLEGPTEQKLEAFQKEQHLPTTGLPDQETLQKLGLKPEDIYRTNPK